MSTDNGNSTSDTSVDSRTLNYQTVDQFNPGSRPPVLITSEGQPSAPSHILASGYGSGSVKVNVDLNEVERKTLRAKLGELLR